MGDSYLEPLLLAETLLEEKAFWVLEETAERCDSGYLVG